MPTKPNPLDNLKKEEKLSLGELAQGVANLLDEGHEPEEVLNFIAYLVEEGSVEEKDAIAVSEALEDALEEEAADNEESDIEIKQGNNEA